MAKSKSKVGINAKMGDATATEKSGGGGGRGLDEIESLFAGKRRSAKEMQERACHEARASKIERERRKRARVEEEEEETALRGFCGGGRTTSTSTGTTTTTTAAAAGGKKKRRGGGDANAPTHLHERATKMKSLTYTREDVERLNNGTNNVDDTTTTTTTTTTKKNINNNNNNGGEARDRWASDGLGGVFNGEGYTGRRDDGGHRVFKAHLMNRRGFGASPDCPFDCDCCFI